MSNRGAVFHDTGDGSLVFTGYDDDYAGMIALLVHLRVRFRALGQDIELWAMSDAAREEDDQQDDQDQDEDAADAISHDTDSTS